MMRVSPNNLPFTTDVWDPNVMTSAEVTVVTTCKKCRVDIVGYSADV